VFYHLRTLFKKCKARALTIACRYDGCGLQKRDSKETIKKHLLVEYMGIDEHGNRSFKINYFNKLNLEDIKEEVLDIKVSTFSMKIDKSLADALYNLFLAATYTVSYVKHTPEPVPHDTYMVYCDRNAGEIHLANRDLMPYTNCCNMIRIIDVLRKAVRDNNAEIIKEHLNDIISLTDSFKKNAPEIL